LQVKIILQKTNCVSIMESDIEETVKTYYYKFVLN